MGFTRYDLPIMLTLTSQRNIPFKIKSNNSESQITSLWYMQLGHLPHITSPNSLTYVDSYDNDNETTILSVYYMIGSVLLVKTKTHIQKPLVFYVLWLWEEAQMKVF